MFSSHSSQLLHIIVIIIIIIIIVIIIIIIINILFYNFLLICYFAAPAARARNERHWYLGIWRGHLLGAEGHIFALPSGQVRGWFLFLLLFLERASGTICSTIGCNFTLDCTFPLKLHSFFSSSVRHPPSTLHPHPTTLTPHQFFAYALARALHISVSHCNQN